VLVFLIVENSKIYEHHINFCFSFSTVMSNPQSSYSVRDILEKDKLNGSNPPEYLEDLEKKKTFKISSSGIYVIELNITTSGSTPWVFDKCLEAAKSEMESMSQNKVWTFVDLLDGVKAIECKCIFKKKIDMDDNIQIYKARLVAKGYKQIHGIDYDETYSPVAMLKSIRILLAIAAHYDYEIWQMDVKTPFLNGNHEEDVYMTQPEGFTVLESAWKVCKLHRSIYGLKQASRSWNICFNEAIKEFDFIRNKEEPCVYKKTSGSAVAFLVLYVDDILLLGNDIHLLQSVKTWLGSCFPMKDMGEAVNILGIRIYRDRLNKIIGLSQDTYIDKVLHMFDMNDSKKGFIPMSHGITLSKTQYPSTHDERERMSKIPYASAIGSIMYANLCTRLAVACALHDEQIPI